MDAGAAAVELQDVAVPPPGEVHVWWATAGDGLDVATRRRLLRDVDERTRHRVARYVRQADQDRGLLAHSLMRRVLAAFVGGAPAAVPIEVGCVSCGSTEHGKPRLAASAGPVTVEFNLTHSGRVVALAVARPGTGVGIDVEAIRRIDWETLRRNVFGDEEWELTAAAPEPTAARFAAWARKEAALKATGHGLSLPLAKVHPRAAADAADAADAAGTANAALGWRATLPDDVGIVTGRDVDIAPDHVAAVALARPEPLAGPPLVRQLYVI